MVIVMDQSENPRLVSTITIADSPTSLAQTQSTNNSAPTNNFLMRGANGKLYQSSPARRVGVTKLMIDTQICIKNGIQGRNLIIGVPHHCETVGDFKVHLCRYYLDFPTPIEFWVDKYNIPDEEHSTFFSVMIEPIRVVPVSADENEKKRSASTSSTSSLRVFPSSSTSTITIDVAPDISDEPATSKPPPSRASSDGSPRSPSSHRQFLKELQNYNLSDSFAPTSHESETKPAPAFGKKGNKRQRKTLGKKFPSIFQIKDENKITPPFGDQAVGQRSSTPVSGKHTLGKIQTRQNTRDLWGRRPQPLQVLQTLEEINQVDPYVSSLSPTSPEIKRARRSEEIETTPPPGHADSITGMDTEVFSPDEILEAEG